MNSKPLLTGLATWILVALGCGGSLAASRVSVSAYDADSGVSLSYFHDDLSDYGHWVDYGSYGSCWVPAGVGSDWRPYEDGYWVMTDYGWTWVSNEPWGWATYHYGRWDYDSYHGWVWIPGATWGPAWVAWHHGDGYVGWAPLPPSAGWSFSLGLSFGSTSRIRADRWCFVPTDRFCDRRVRTHVVPIARNGHLLKRTRDATRYDVRDGRPLNRGIDVAYIEKNSGRRVPRLRLVDADSPRGGHGRQKGDAIALYRPRVRGGDLKIERPAERRGNERTQAPRVRRDEGGQERGRDIDRKVVRGRGRPDQNQDREQIRNTRQPRRDSTPAKIQRQGERPKQSIDKQKAKPQRRIEARQRGKGDQNQGKEVPGQGQPRRDQRRRGPERQHR